MAGNLSLSVILSAVDRLTGPFLKSEEAIKRLNRVAAQARDLERLGTRLSIAGFAANAAASQMARMTGAVTRPLIALDSAAAKISSMPGITEEAVGRIVAAGRLWSKEHVATADQFVNTSYIMLSAGLNEAQAIAATQAAAALATATFGDNADAGNLLAVIYNNMGDKSKDAGTELNRLADVLARTQQVFQLRDMGQLTEGLKMATPAALGAGVALTQLTAVVGQLNNAGMQGGMAGTSFSGMLRQMIPASKMLGFNLKRSADGGLDLMATLDAMKKRFGDLSKLTDVQREALQKAFGDEGLKAVMLLLPNLEALRTNLDLVGNSAGAVAEAQAKIEKSAANQLQIANNNLSELKTIVGSQLLPPILNLMKAVTPLAEKFGALAKENPGLVKVAATVFLVGTGLLAVVGPILAVAGGFALITSKAFGLVGVVLVVTKVVKLLGAALMVNPLGAFVAALAVGAFLIIDNWEKLKLWFSTFIFWISDAFAGLTNLLPDWLVNLPANLSKMTASLSRPTVQTIGTTNSAMRVGGELRIKVETDSGTRARVAGLRSDNRNVPIDVDTGPMMVMP